MNTKSFRFIQLLFAVICLGLVTNGYAVKGGKKGPPVEEIPVTVTFFPDAGTRITSDGLGTYDSAIGNGGAIWRFILDLRDNAPNRELFLNFSDCISVDGCGNELPAPFPTGLTVDALMFLNVADGSDFIDIALGVENAVAGVLTVNFNDSNGVAYGLRFDSARESGTTDVQIERIGDETTGAGHAWQITTVSMPVAILYKRGGSKGPQSKRRVDIGLYTMPARFTLEEN